ncbi:MAG: DoxX family membrane protein [Anaerolineales bacterium]
MQTSSGSYRRMEIRFTRWLARHGLLILRICIGIIFFWFGFLKFFPGLSPAQTLAGKTIEKLSFGLLKPEISVLILATWECLIGLGLFVGKFMRATLALLWLQMLGTITPLFLFPNEVFTKVPYAPTLEGQYIIKNLVLISASLILAATVRGGAIVADPEAVQRASSLGATGDQ